MKLFDDASERHGKCPDCIEKQKGNEKLGEQVQIEKDLRVLASIK